MSAFRESAQALLEVGLRCPKCPAVNRPRATYIAVEPNGTASCMVCAHTGPIAAFQPPPASRP